MRGLVKSVPSEIIDDTNSFRYRERFSLSSHQLVEEPLEELNKAYLIWSLDNDRDKLEAERAKAAKRPR